MALLLDRDATDRTPSDSSGRGADPGTDTTPCREASGETYQAPNTEEIHTGRRCDGVNVAWVRSTSPA